MASLHIENIHKRFGSVHVLKGINLAIEQGEFLILVGPSGCGKSTLLSMIAGLDDISDGQIRIGDKVVNDVSPKDRDIAMVFQSYALYPSMTVRENIEFGLKIKKIPKAERDASVAKVAKVLQIEALLDRRPSQLSGGQRQRVAMGRALARDPEIFLFDEPLSNLDAKLRVEMRAEIKALHQRLKTTIVYVTHDQIEAMTLGDKIAVMRDGLVQQFGSPAEIYDRPANMFVASFIGSPTMNFVSGQLRAGGGAAGTAILNIEGISHGFELLGSNTTHLGAVKVGIRPEHFQLLDGPQSNSIEALVEWIEPTGADTFVSARIADHKVLVRCSAKTSLRAGSTVHLGLDLASLSLFDPATEARIT